MGMLERVLDVLKDVKGSNYDKAPPLHRFCWRHGIFIAPPILAGFWLNALFMGLFFAVAWGAVMTLFFVLFMGVPTWLSLLVTPLVALLAGAFYGLSMAIYARVKASHNEPQDLPTWQSLVDAERKAH